MKGVYQHCAEKHLQRYVDEFDFVYNSRDPTDAERIDLAIKGANGKHLTYRTPRRTALFGEIGQESRDRALFGAA